jgi:hypothetical protein
MISPRKLKRVIALKAEGRTQLSIAGQLHLTVGTVAGIVQRERNKIKPRETNMIGITTITDASITAPTLVWNAISLLDLKPSQCRYSTSTADDADGYPLHLFCGKQAMAGRPYCAQHVALTSVGLRPPLARLARRIR